MTTVGYGDISPQSGSTKLLKTFLPYVVLAFVYTLQYYFAHILFSPCPNIRFVSLWQTGSPCFFWHNFLFESLLLCKEDIAFESVDNVKRRSRNVCWHLLCNIRGPCDGPAHPHHRQQLRRILQRSDEEGEVPEEEAGAGAGNEGWRGGKACRGNFVQLNFTGIPRSEITT